MASTTMALARAFTKRSKRNQEPTTPSRGFSVRHPAGTIDRSLISLPTELISTTNVHALNAPDISSLNAARTSNDASSDSDFSHIDRSFLNTPVLSADTSSIDSSPITPSDSETRDFFDSTPKRPRAAMTADQDSSPSLDAPAVPKRALTHSKKAHVELSRKRSIQRMSPPPDTLARPSSRQAHGSAEHPFRKELAQVNEVAEEFGVASSVLEEEEQEMRRKGLKKFGAQDYLDEIAELWGGIFEDQLGPLAKPWL